MSGPAVPDPAAGNPPEAPGQTGFFENLVDLYFAPGDAFARLLRRPQFVVPLLLSMALGAVMNAVWLRKVDAGEFTKQQIEGFGRWDRLPDEAKSRIIQEAPRNLQRNVWIGVVVGAPLLFSVFAGLFLFVFRFFYAGEVTFKQSLAIVATAFTVVGLVTTPLTLGVMALKGDWNMRPDEALQANLGMALDRETTPKALHSAASSLDLLSFWRLFLLAAGFAALSRKPASWALPGVAVPWVLYVLVKAGASALF